MKENVKKMLAENRDAVTREAVAEAEKMLGRTVGLDELGTIYCVKTLALGAESDFPTVGGVLASFHSGYFTGVRHSHDFFEMSFVLSGYVEDETDDEKIMLGAGDAVIHPPLSSHAICSCSDPDGLVNIVLSREMLTDSFYSSLLRDKNLETTFYCRAPQSPGAIPVRCIGDAMRVVDLLLGELASPERSQTVVESALLLLLAQLLRGYKSVPRDVKGEISAYIAENITSVSLSSVADRFGYNPKYFSGLFKKLFGKSFVEVVRDARLDYAATLLGCTDYSVEKVAELVGYRDPAALYDGFKARFSTTPAAMRRKN